jgi:tetraacyldisaccharide-1-P 4'-kinase
MPLFSRLREGLALRIKQIQAVDDRQLRYVDIQLIDGWNHHVIIRTIHNAMCRNLPASSAYAIAPVLRFLASAYQARESFRQFLYRAGVLSASSLPAPVISVGNLTSASGKTPFVQHLARHYYQFHGISSLIIQLGSGTVDEAIMLEHDFAGTPIKVVGDTANPAELKQILIDFPSIRLVLLDNGLQHLPLMRDLDIVTLNAFTPLGNGHLMPRGSLREPPGPALRRADAVVVHHVDIAGEERVDNTVRLIERMLPRHTLRVQTVMMPTMLRFIVPMKRTLDMSADSSELGGLVGLSILEKSAIVFLTGVGSPFTVEEHAKRLGALHVEGCGSIGCSIHEDHHHFTSDEVHEAVARVKLLMKDDRYSHVCIVLTEKDFWRQRHFWSSVFIRYNHEIWDGTDQDAKKKKWGAYILRSELQLQSHDSRFSSESAMWAAMLRLATDHFRGRSYC